MGKRICRWKRGNISVRLSKECVLCTPTYMSKGRMQPSDLCMVDLGGKQLAGDRRITSEIKTHLAILRKNANAGGCVHAHPPYTTSYAVCGQLPPLGAMAEAEIFLGDIGLVPYATPGSPLIVQYVEELSVGRTALLRQGMGQSLGSKRRGGLLENGKSGNLLRDYAFGCLPERYTCPFYIGAAA